MHVESIDVNPEILTYFYLKLQWLHHYNWE